MKKKDYCNCYSYNWNIGKKKTILLSPPKWLSDKKSIAIDYCISNVIKYLWNNKVNTGGSCCGHNKIKPSVVIKDGDPKKVLNLIKKIDKRKWIVYKWELKGYEN